MYRFIYAPETISLASHIALLDAGVTPDLQRLSFADKEQQSAHYTRINPKARVPTLITPDGALTETPAILGYIAQQFPDAGLMPLGDPYQCARIHEFCSYIASTLHVAHAHRMRGHRWVDPANTNAIKAMQAKIPDSVGAAFQFIEDHYLSDSFVMGDAYTIADPYLFTVARWIESDGVSPDDFPKVAAHRAMMLQRPTVIAALKAQS